MNNFFENVIGHKYELELLKSFCKNYLPSSIIFSGEKGVGKLLIAQKFAEYFINSKLKNCNKKLYNNIFIVNSNDLEKLNIEGIRNLIKEMSLTSINDLEKFFIINDFDSLNINCKNALLKNLEEPHDNIKIIIISHRYESLLKTVKSRCININFGVLDEEDFNMFLNHKEPDISNDERKILVSLCEGRPGIYKVIKDLNWIEISKIIDQIINIDDIDYEKINEVYNFYEKETFFIDFLIKKQLYNSSINKLLENYNNKKVFKSIINFIHFASKAINLNININLKNYYMSIFIYYFRFVKQSDE